MQLVVLGLNHKTVPVDIREQFAISPDSARSGLIHLDEQEGIEEAVVLSTCNRTEIYAVLKDETAKETLYDFFLALSGNSEAKDEYFFYFEGEACIRHLFEVVSGLDSMVIGESQILNQIKTAYTMALEEKATRTILNTLSPCHPYGQACADGDADFLQCGICQLCSGETRGKDPGWLGRSYCHGLRGR